MSKSDLLPGVLALMLENPQWPPQVGRRLSYCLHNWERLISNQFVLQTVKGLVIPLERLPVQTSEPHQYPHNQKESLVISEEISKMREKSAIKVVSQRWDQFISPLYLMPKKDDRTPRPVINLKKLNMFVTYQHFKMEELHL